MDYAHKVGDYVKLMHDKSACTHTTKLITSSEGPFQIVEVYNNGAIQIQRGKYREIVSITRVSLYFKKD